jgi:PmbA protein
MIGAEKIAELRRALERAGAHEWEIHYEEERELTVEVQDGEVDAYESAAPAGAGVRVLDGGRLGFAYTTDFGAQSLAFVAETACAAAAAADPEPELSLPSREEIGALPATETVDRSLRDVTTEQKIESARLLERSALESSPRIARARKASYGEAWARWRLVSSRGIDLEDEATIVHCDVMAVAELEEEEQLGWDAHVGHFFRELDFAACGKKAGLRAAAMLGAAPVPTGRYKVVLEPQVVAEILDVASEWLLGESVAKKRSLLAGREGQRVAGETVTIVDDGTHPRGAATSRFDGEGMPRRRTMLVERGILRGFLYDRLWARKCGRTTTGNSDRGGFRAPPGLGPSNLIIEPGAGGDAHALDRAMGEGIRVAELIGVQTADPISGDFSVGAGGQLIRGGDVVGPVSGVTVAGNLLGLLGAVELVGSDLRFFGSTGAPSLLIGALDIAGE